MAKSSIAASGLSVSYDPKNDSVSLTRDDGFNINIEKGSKNDLLLRKELLSAGIGNTISVDFHAPDTVLAGIRTITADVANDHRLISDINEEGRVDDFHYTGIFNNLGRIPSYDTLMLWFENNQTSPEVVAEFTKHEHLFRVKNAGVLNNKYMELFIKIFLWGGPEIFGANIIGKRSGLHILSTNWRHDKPVDMWELLFVMRFAPDALDWNRLTVSELANVVARSRAGIAAMHGNPRAKRTKDVIGKLQRARIHHINEFKKISADGLMWYVHYCAMQDSLPTANIPHNPFSASDDPHDVLSKAYYNFMQEAALHNGYDDSIEFLDKAFFYHKVGICDYDAISSAIENDIDPELLLATISPEVSVA